MDANELTGRDKLRAVAQQIALETSMSDGPVVLSCPYCEGTTKQGETFCCRMLLDAVEAVMDAQTTIRNLEVVERALQKHYRN